MRKRVSTHKLIIAAVAAMIIPLLLINWLIGKSLIDQYEKELVNSSTSQAVILRTTFDARLEELINLSYAIYTHSDYMRILKKPYGAVSYQLLEDQDFLNTYLTALTNKRYVSGAYIYTDAGYTFYSSGWGPLYDGQLDWLLENRPKDDAILFLGPESLGALEHKRPVFTMLYNIYDFSSSEDIALLQVDIDPMIFALDGRESEVADGLYYAVVDRNLNVIYDNSGHISGYIGTEAAAPIRGRESASFILNSGSFNDIIASETIDALGWKVITAWDYNDVIAKARSYQVIVLILALSAVAVFIAISVLILVNVSNPINRLAKYMERSRGGNLEQVEATGCTKEILRLYDGYNYMIGRINHLITNEYTLTFLRQEAEYKALEAHINPHFLYNTLQSIGAMAIINRVPRINTACRILSSMLRFSLGQSGAIVPIAYEVGYVEDYLAIINMRFEDKVKYTLSMGDELGAYGIPKFVLQPLVENCVLHGRGDGTRDLTIAVRIRLDGEAILLVVEDDGIGMEEERVEAVWASLAEEAAPGAKPAQAGRYEGGIGVSNIHHRIRLYYGERYGVSELASVPGVSTRVTLTFPARLA